MEEDDEIQSQQSPETGSPALSSSPPRPNGRITVTVASAPPQPQSQTQPPQHKTLTLALPIQPRNNGGGGGSGGGGGGREDCWSEGATSVLIEAWGDRYLELSRGNLKQKHWKEVADIVSGREDYTKTPKTDIQCKNRIDTVKKKYKLEKQKIATGAGPSKWPFFERLDHLIGPTAKIAGVVMNNTPPAASQKVPLGIPVGIGVRYNNNQPKPLQVVLKNSGQRILHQEQQQQQFRKRDVGLELDSDSEADSMDSLPPPLPRPPKRARNRMMVMGKVEESGKMRGGGEGEGGGWGNAVKELTQAILRFGEAYEQAENAKLQQVVEMEKQRMKFAKELELQRMQFFMNTQMEISQLRRKSGGGSGSNHHSNNNINNSDCSN